MGWKRIFQYNTSLEKKLLMTVGVLSGVILVLFICLLASPRELATCNSPECVRAAKYILDTIDPTVDPCEDFYNFTCGTFLKNAYSLGQPNTLHYLNDLVKNKLKEIVIETTNERNMSRMLKMQRKFYRACTNEKDIEEDGNKTFFNLLDELLGGWPVVKNYRWVEKDFEWKKTMVKAREMGFFYEFFFKVEIYLCDNNDTYSLWIKPPSRENISSFHWKDQNVNIIAEIASDMGADSVETRSHLRRAILFAEQLEQIVEKYENATANRKPSEIKRTAIKDLHHTFIKIDWIEFLRNITHLPLLEDDLVILDVDVYFRDLYFLLMKTQKKVQANYIAWAIISTNIDYFTKTVREKYKKIVKCKTNIKTDITRNDKCYQISIGLFPFIAESEYIRRYTPLEKRTYVTNIIKNVKRQLEIAIHKNSWMDMESKENTIRHLRSINSAIGWTDIVYNSHKFEQLFGYYQVKLESTYLIDMARTLSIHGVNRYYRRLTYTPKEVIEEYFKSPHIQVNAYYTSYLKAIILLTPILQGFIFHEARPHYMNYGSLGSIVGHELTHGISQDSIDFDTENNTLWSNTTRENLKNVAQCLIDDYDEFPDYVNGFSKNGSISLEENLADFTGINIAYAAYRDWERHNAHEDFLPGIKYTPKQVFWITASNFLCYDSKVPAKDVRKKAVSHAAPRFRVIARIKNSPHFADDFGCHLGSKMNPKKKCQIFT